MKKALLAAAFLTAALSASAQTTVVSNLTESNYNWNLLSFSADRAATSFTVGGTAATLANVTLAFPDNATGLTGFKVELYSNTAAQPGTLLETLSGSASPNNGTFTYTSAGLSLSANATYWLVFQDTSGRGIYMNLTTSDTETSSLGWTIGNTGLYSGDSGATWSATPFGAAALQFSVAASPVPEPSTYAALAGLAACGLVLLRRRRGAA